LEPVLTDLLSVISVKSELLAGPRSLELPLHSGVDGFAEFDLSMADMPDMMYLEEKALPVLGLGVLRIFLQCISSFVWLQPL
jgi:hypothetical protein